MFKLASKRTALASVRSPHIKVADTCVGAAPRVAEMWLGLAGCPALSLACPDMLCRSCRCCTDAASCNQLQMMRCVEFCVAARSARPCKLRTPLLSLQIAWLDTIAKWVLLADRKALRRGSTLASFAASATSARHRRLIARIAHAAS